MIWEQNVLVVVMTTRFVDNWLVWCWRFNHVKFLFYCRANSDMLTLQFLHIDKEEFKLFQREMCMPDICFICVLYFGIYLTASVNRAKLPFFYCVWWFLCELFCCVYVLVGLLKEVELSADNTGHWMRRAFNNMITLWSSTVEWCRTTATLSLLCCCRI